MPKVKSMAFVRELKRLPEASMQDMFAGCQKQARLKDEELARRLDLTVSGVRHKRSKGITNYRLAEVKSWANAIGIPAQDLAQAFREYLEK